MTKFALIIALILAFSAGCIIIQPPSPQPAPTPTPTPEPVIANTIEVYAQHNGASWNGQLSYNISGPSARSGYSVPQTFSGLGSGSYTISYTGGGPAGASLASISPAETETLYNGAIKSFTFIFRSSSPSVGSASVNATLDGAFWQGSVNFNLTHYAISGPVEVPGYSVPATLGNLSAGNIQLNYVSGGPAGARLSGITPEKQQYLEPGGFLTYTMHFERRLLQ